VPGQESRRWWLGRHPTDSVARHRLRSGGLDEIEAVLGNWRDADTDTAAKDVLPLWSANKSAKLVPARSHSPFTRVNTTSHPIRNCIVYPNRFVLTGSMLFIMIS
jgi:hypothetical protein